MGTNLTPDTRALHDPTTRTDLTHVTRTIRTIRTIRGHRTIPTLVQVEECTGPGIRSMIPTNIPIGTDSTIPTHDDHMRDIDVPDTETGSRMSMSKGTTRTGTIWRRTNTTGSGTVIRQFTDQVSTEPDTHRTRRTGPYDEFYRRRFNQGYTDGFGRYHTNRYDPRNWNREYTDSFYGPSEVFSEGFPATPFPRSYSRDEEENRNGYGYGVTRSYYPNEANDTSPGIRVMMVIREHSRSDWRRRFGGKISQITT